MSLTVIVFPLLRETQALDHLVGMLDPQSIRLIIANDTGNQEYTDFVDEHQWIMSIEHEKPVGYGTCVQNAIELSREMEYDTLILADPSFGLTADDLKVIDEQRAYGFDFISLSRFLENPKHETIETSRREIMLSLGYYLHGLTGIDTTDPLSPVKAFSSKLIDNLDLTDVTHAVLLQVYIQLHYLGMTHIEIPMAQQHDPGEELDFYEEPEEMFLSVMETESHLFKKDTIN